MLSKIKQSVLSVKNSVTCFVNDLSIKTKLMFYFIVFSAVFITSIGVASYIKSSNMLNRQSVVYSDALLRQVTDRVEKLKQEIMDISITFLVDRNMERDDFNSLDTPEYT